MRLKSYFIFSLVLMSCYPLTTTRSKWKIKWDRELLAGKEVYTQETESPGPESPNIIVIVADDLGRFEVSAYDGVNHIQTPEIDRLGSEGVVFENAYVTAPTCAPSRAGLITGRMQNRFGFETQLMEFYPTNMIEYLTGKYIVDTEDWVVASKPQYPAEWQVHKQGVPPSEITLAEAMKKYGYATGITGKWHLGMSKHNLPLNRGFDYQYGFNGAFSLYAPEKNWNKVINYVGDGFSTRYQWESGRYGEGAIEEMGEEIREEQYLTFAIRDRAINFIEKNKDNPFFLYCTFSAPHIPFQAPVDYYCQFEHVEDENKRVYYAMIAALDDAIGSINQKVKDLGLEENTMIFLISDNGGASYTGATDNGPLKGGKLMQFDGGLRVPFMMKWKGKVDEGKRYSKPVMSTDIFSTAVLGSGGMLPPDREYDGVNLIPYVNGNITENPHDRMFWRADHIWAVRDGRYKLILSTRDGWAELYHIDKDISESINLAEEMPELLEKMRQMHLEWQQNELPEKPMWPRIMDHKFIIDGKEYLFPA